MCFSLRKNFTALPRSHMLGVMVVLQFALTASTFAAELIIIDAGHGELTVGAKGDCTRTEFGSTGKCIRSRADNKNWPEGIWTLGFSKWIYDYINVRNAEGRTDAVPYLTRKKSRNIGFDERIARAKKYGANIIISVHFNSDYRCKGNDNTTGCENTARGVETLYDGLESEATISKTKKFCGDLRIATDKAVRGYYKKYKYVNATRTMANRETKPFRSVNSNSPIASRFFTQIRRTKWPHGRPLACFLEIEFMDHKSAKQAFLTDGRLGKLKPEVKYIADQLGDFLVSRNTDAQKSEFTDYRSILNRIDSRMGAGTKQLAIHRDRDAKFDTHLKTGQQPTFGDQITLEVMRHLSLRRTHLSEYLRQVNMVPNSQDQKRVSLVSQPLCPAERRDLEVIVRKKNEFLAQRSSRCRTWMDLFRRMSCICRVLR